jgi:hypothetical protein
MRQFLAVFFLAGLSVAYAEPCRAGGDWPDGQTKRGSIGCNAPITKRTLTERSIRSRFFAAVLLTP